MGFPEHLDHRFFVPWEGVVIDDADPDGLHRVKIRIPGLIEETRWSFPLTSGGGSPNRGGHIVPAVGATVVVWFMGGDVERPRYQAAHWGVRKDTGNESPKTIAAAGADAHLVSEWEIGPLLFTLDERERDEESGSGQRFSVTDTIADKVIAEYDFALQGWSIQADYLIELRSGGFVRINGLQVSINGRTGKRGTVRQF